MDKYQTESGLVIKGLAFSIERIYTPCGFEFSELVREKEGLEYSACNFKINSLYIRFRSAKITPTKIGQFVTLWQRPQEARSKKAPIEPYNVADIADLFVIAVKKDDLFGQFIFPKSILHEKGILSSVMIDGKGSECVGGKRAMRVYPPWDIALSSLAQKTQAWQLEYFLDASKSAKVDYTKARSLYGL
ncbi:MAG: MepB family protein [Pseudomonadota bacterium]